MNGFERERNRILTVTHATISGLRPIGDRQSLQGGC